ncbi:MAG: recombinase family protein [Candidatus Sungbacteria bacterium]|uniref:Recombinase family protein n=1 Tax=Candidatus Sungiibacteriota bacterium TaxID=2750080 RepID=A0A9D6LPU8_9BACT|nr:recombinase family protein [Candidatus Sungbacteria bacterium]
MRYVIYARKSTEDEDRQILSIEAQLVELKEFAAKEKLEIVASFQEAKTAKEPDEKHRLEPYFWEKKIFS